MNALTIFLKEFIDLIRDRRALFSGLAYVAFGPLAVLLTVNMLAGQTRDTSYAPIKFCGPSSTLLAEQLTAAGLAFDEKASICVNAPADFEARLAEGKAVRVIDKRKPYGRRRRSIAFSPCLVDIALPEAT